MVKRALYKTIGAATLTWAELSKEIAAYPNPIHVPVPKFQPPARTGAIERGVKTKGNVPSIISPVRMCSGVTGLKSTWLPSETQSKPQLQEIRSEQKGNVVLVKSEERTGASGRWR